MEFNSFNPPLEFDSNMAIKLLEEDLLNDAAALPEYDNPIDTAISLGIKPALSQIATKSKDKDSRRLATRLDQLLPDNIFAGWEEGEESLGASTSTQIADKATKIYFNPQATEKHGKEETVLHEALHAAIQPRLASMFMYGSDKNRKLVGEKDTTVSDAVNDLKSAWIGYKRWQSNRPEEERKNRASWEDIVMDDVEEFTVRVLTQPELMEQVDQIKDNRKTVEVTNLMDRIKSLIGLEELPRYSKKDTYQGYANRLLDALPDIETDYDYPTRLMEYSKK